MKERKNHKAEKVVNHLKNQQANECFQRADSV